MTRYGNEAPSSDNDNESRIELDRDQITFGRERPPPTTTVTNRLRRFLEPGLLVAAIGVIVLAAHAIGNDGAPAAGRATGGPPTSQVAPGAEATSTARSHLRLVAPQTATPGERLTVLTYRNRRLCGPTELRFDGAPAVQQLVRYAGRLDPDYAETFVTLDVPRNAKPGRHVIDLYGPRPGGRGPICGDVPEHQGLLATATITVGSSHG
jgi:hypothetical protein